MLILVVDDDTSMRAIVAMTLHDLGHKTVQADSGAAAFQLANEIKPDIVITDHQMGSGMTGADLEKKLRTSGYRGKIIGMSGTHEFGERFLAKPFSTKELVEALS